MIEYLISICVFLFIFGFWMVKNMDVGECED